MKQVKILLVSVLLCICMLITAAAAEKVGFISNARGNDNNDGLSDLTPKQYQGKADGKGIRNLLDGGGTLVACGNFNISSNDTWDYGGAVTLTGSYDGIDYKRRSSNTGIFKIANGKMLTVASDLTIDDILLLPGAENSSIRVKSGVTLVITDTVEILEDTLVILVEQGGTAILEGGTYKAILGAGEVKTSEGVKVLQDKLPGFISNAKGNDNNDGLSAASPKQNQGKVGGNGARNLLYGGGTLVACGNFTISSNETFDYGGPMTVTGSYNGVSYKNYAANTGIFNLKAGKTLTVTDDLTFDDLFILSGEPYSAIRVKAGATLTITETVDVLSPTLVIYVEKGAKADIRGGTYMSVQGSGDISLGKNVQVAKKAIGFISNASGNDNNDGLSDATPKQYQGQADGKGIRNLLYGGGTLVVCGNFNISSNETWDYGGAMTVTGSYNGKDYKDYDLNTGVFKLNSDKTLTVTGELTFDDILFLPGDSGSVLRVPSGATLKITDTVEFQANTLAIEVEKGGTAILEGGTYVAVRGEGDIRMSDTVKVVGGTGVYVPDTPKTVFISNTGGKNSHDGLSAVSPKQYIGAASGNGARNLLGIGGVLVVSGDCGIKNNLDWKVDGKVTVTAKANGTDYRNAANGSGVIDLYPNVVLTVSSDLTFEDIIIHASDTYNVIRVTDGVTLTIAESVTCNTANIAIEVEKGGKAVIESGSYLAIRGEGILEVSDAVEILPKTGIGNFGTPVKGTPLGNVGFISNAKGNDNNDGRSGAKPKQLQGNVGGKGIRNLLYGGGTLVVCGNFNISSNETWDYGGKVTLTGSYDGIDYRNFGANTGVFKLANNKTLSVASELALEDVLLQVGATSALRVKNNTVLLIGDTVSVVNENGEADKCRLIVDAGAVAILSGNSLRSFTVEGDGEVLWYDVETGTVSAAPKDAPAEEHPEIPEQPVEQPSEQPPAEVVTVEGAVYLSETGSNDNDGLSAATPKKNLGTPFGTGAYSMLTDGGHLVLCGNLPVSGDYTWRFGGAVTVTANCNGKDHKDPLPAINPTAGCMKFASGTVFTVCSDLTLDDMIFFQADAQNTIVVQDATFTVTDTVQFMRKSGGMNQCTLILNDGATAVLSEAAQKVFAVEGNGTVLPYVPKLASEK